MTTNTIAAAIAAAKAPKNTVTIHMLAFDSVLERRGDASYGKLQLRVKGETDEEMASQAFEQTNAPHATPDVVSQSGRTYSMSVGDVVEIDGTDRFLIVDGCGFIPVCGMKFRILLSIKARYEATPGRRFNFAVEGKARLGL